MGRLGLPLPVLFLLEKQGPRERTEGSRALKGDWSQLSALPISSCVTSGKLLNDSVFLHL